MAFERYLAEEVAIDLLSAEGGTAALGDEASAMVALSAASQERHLG